MLAPKLGVAAVTVATVIGLSSQLHPHQQTPAQQHDQATGQVVDAEEKAKEDARVKGKADADAIYKDGLHLNGIEMRPADKAAERLFRVIR
jgi:hypothetical protein